VPGEREFYAPYRERAAARKAQERAAKEATQYQLRKLEMTRRQQERQFQQQQERLSKQFGLTHGLSKKKYELDVLEAALKGQPKPQQPSEFERLMGRFPKGEQGELIKRRFGWRPDRPEQGPERMRLYRELIESGMPKEQAKVAVFPGTREREWEPSELDQLRGLVGTTEGDALAKQLGVPLQQHIEELAFRERHGFSKLENKRRDAEAKRKKEADEAKARREKQKAEREAFLVEREARIKVHTDKAKALLGLIKSKDITPAMQVKYAKMMEDEFDKVAKLVEEELPEPTIDDMSDDDVREVFGY